MRRSSARTFRLVAMTAASAAVAACGLSGNNNTNALLAGPTGQPITVGISLPLAGPQQAGGFQPDGLACKKGYELWASDVNSHGGLLGRPVKLIILNDKGDPKVDGNNYRILITQDHVDLTLAPFSSLLTASPGAAAQVTEQYGYALAAGSAGAPTVYALNDHALFSTNVPAAQQMMPFARWLVKQAGHPLTAAYPEVDDPFADPPVEQAEHYLGSHGVKTVFSNIDHHYSPTATARMLTADAKQMAQLHHPQMVFLGSIAVSTVQAFMKGFQEAKWTPKYFIASSGPDQGAEFINAVGPGAAVGAMVPNGWFGGFPYPLSHVMVQDYIAKYGGTAADINADVAESYSAGEVEAAAVQATGSLNQQAIINWLHKPTTTVQTVLGPVHFKSDGENSDIAPSALIFQWQPGQGGSGAPQFVQVLPNALGSKSIIPWAG
jgi:branched-chain amino acid transport system substrate-binding protein